MLTYIDASTKKFAKSSFKLYKVIMYTEYTERMSDPLYKGDSYLVGDEVYCPIEIVDDGYESFINSASCAFTDEGICRDLIKELNRQYHCVSGCFDVIEVLVDVDSVFYTGYSMSSVGTVKVYALESFRVLEVVHEES